MEVEFSFEKLFEDGSDLKSMEDWKKFLYLYFLPESIIGNDHDKMIFIDEIGITKLEILETPKNNIDSCIRFVNKPPI